MKSFLMNIHPIHTKADYRLAKHRIDAVWHAKLKSQEADELKVLSLLVEEYEKKNIAMSKIDPDGPLLHVMHARQLSRKDLEPDIGTRARVAEVLNRVRELVTGNDSPLV